MLLGLGSLGEELSGFWKIWVQFFILKENLLVERSYVNVKSSCKMLVLASWKQEEKSGIVRIPAGAFRIYQCSECLYLTQTGGFF